MGGDLGTSLIDAVRPLMRGMRCSTLDAQVGGEHFCLRNPRNSEIRWASYTTTTTTLGEQWIPGANTVKTAIT